MTVKTLKQIAHIIPWEFQRRLKHTLPALHYASVMSYWNVRWQCTFWMATQMFCISKRRKELTMISDPAKTSITENKIT